MKLLLRGYDKNGALVPHFTREVDVVQPGDGVYNVPTGVATGEQAVATVTVSAVV